MSAESHGEQEQSEVLSHLCTNISTGGCSGKVAPKNLSVQRPITSCLSIIAATEHGLDDGSKKVKNTTKLARQADLAELIGHREFYQNN